MSTHVYVYRYMYMYICILSYLSCFNNLGWKYTYIWHGLVRMGLNIKKLNELMNLFGLSPKSVNSILCKKKLMGRKSQNNKPLSNKITTNHDGIVNTYKWGTATMVLSDWGEIWIGGHHISAYRLTHSDSAKATYGGFLSHRATPSHHPFLDGIFPNKHHPAVGVPSFFSKPPYGCIW